MGLGTGSGGDGGEGDEDTSLKRFISKLKCAQHTRDVLLCLVSAKTSNAPTLSS